MDKNQAEIVKALRDIGVSVAITSNVGNGFPDLVCAARHANRNVLIEVKAEGECLTPEQVRFHASWRGPIFIVHSVAEALELFLIAKVNAASFA